MTHPLYASFTFPDYEFREYPKYVTPPDGGKPIIVNNSKEERELLSEGEFTPTHEPEPEKDEKTLLLERAKALGVEVNKSWGLARLRDAVEAAEA